MVVDLNSSRYFELAICCAIKHSESNPVFEKILKENPELIKKLGNKELSYLPVDKPFKVCSPTEVKMMSYGNKVYRIEWLNEVRSINLLGTNAFCCSYVDYYIGVRIFDKNRDKLFFEFCAKLERTYYHTPVPKVDNILTLYINEEKALELLDFFKALEKEFWYYCE